jgi:hypothetical protein
MLIELTAYIRMFSKWQGVWLLDIARNMLALEGEVKEKMSKVEMREMMK